MHSAVLTSIKRVSSDFSTVAGAMSAGLGWAAEHWGYTEPVPSWAWWLLAIVLLFVAAVRSETAAERAREANRKTNPTWGLWDKVVPWITANAERHGNYPAMQMVSIVLADIREKAILGQVVVFGRGKNQDQTGRDIAASPPRERIPQEIWSTHKISWTEFVGSYTGLVLPIQGKPDPLYSDLWFDEIEVKQAWPKKAKKRARLNWPAAFAAFRKAIRQPRT